MSFYDPAQFERMGPRARKASTLLSLYYQAELAETLLRGKAGPRSFTQGNRKTQEQQERHPSVSAVFAKMAQALSKEKKAKLVQRLLETDPHSGRPLSADAKRRLSKIVDPDSKTPLSERFPITKELADILTPEENAQIKTPEDLQAHNRGILQEFFPGQLATMPQSGTKAAPPDQDQPLDDAPPTIQDAPPATVFPDQAIVTGVSAVEFLVDRVTCIRETRGEAGADEIRFAALGAVGLVEAYDVTEASGYFEVPGIPADRQGDQPVTDEFDAGSFRTSDTAVFDPPIVPMRFETGTMSLPLVFVTFFSMAETDPQGGFTAYLFELDTALRAEINYLTNEATMTVYLGMASFIAASLMAGFTIGSIGGPIGLLVGALIGIAVGILGALVIWLGAMFANRDDIFDLQIRALELSPETLTGWPFHGNTTSVPLEFRTQGDGGTYDVIYRWRLVGQPQIERNPDFIPDQDQL
ncbi:hypothetical protein [uncultured Shimia sp.]|uniref:hypothetical protein n=1 Tax=uncultured Shimia sp. TaxID=573152 RepID=UPI002605C47A|nr:hypothetical protein [uncultured Shimia sp.]